MAISDSFVTWEEGEPISTKRAQTEMARAYASVEPIVRSTSHTHVRRGMNRQDYEIFRPGESAPRGRIEILESCTGAYERVSPIKNIIDMMVDFTIQGIKLVHSQPQVGTVFDNWWEHIDGVGRSRHFANNFYLMGTAVVKRNLAKLSRKVIDDLEQGIAAQPDVYDSEPDPQPKFDRYVVPWSYNFLNPLLVNVLGGDLALFAGQPIYGLQIPTQLVSSIRNPRTTEEIQLVDTLPSYIVDSVKSGQKHITLDDSRLYVAHYAKNDWQPWAIPILYSVMDDIMMLQKMKLTDLAALDGAISHIRIWKLGSLEKHIVPTAAAFKKLSEVLKHAGNGQSIDFIWGPDLTLEETTSDIYKYLGQEKYVPILASLFSGLGIPPSLVGGVGGEKGFTNNSMSLKTWIARLNHGRQALTRFWNNEIQFFQRAMRYRFPAQVEFKAALLTDEASFNSFLIDCLDRDVVPVSVVREHLGYIPEIQDAMLRAENRARTSGKMPLKAGPFHDPQQDYGYKKIFAQTGTVVPSQIGVELDKKKSGEKTALEQRQKPAAPPNTNTPPANNDLPSGVQFQGRPKNSLDTTTRKTKQVVPRTRGNESTFINLQLWARDAQQTIAEIVNPIFLKLCNKKNMRQLTTTEVEEIEHLKFVLLCSIEPHQVITQNLIVGLLQCPLPAHSEADHYWRAMVSDFMKVRNSVPTVDDVRQIQNYVYALYKGNVDYGQNND